MVAMITDFLGFSRAFPRLTHGYNTYLSSIMVDVVTDLSDAVLKDTTGGRVSDHHSCKIILVLLNLNSRG